jgi:hypothetical protein
VRRSDTVLTLVRRSEILPSVDTNQGESVLTG